MFKINQIAAGALAVLACAGAGAVSLGPFSGSSTNALPPGSFGPGASFDDIYTFSVTNRSYLDIVVKSPTDATTVHTPFGDFTVMSGLTSFDAWLDGTPLTSSSTTTGTRTTTTLSTLQSIVAAGSGHTLEIKGVAGPSGGSYGNGLLNLAAAPVPEPETYALMLAGLVAIGFLARRRNER